jgi:hypothetical protein
MRAVEFGSTSSISILVDWRGLVGHVDSLVWRGDLRFWGLTA